MLKFTDHPTMEEEVYALYAEALLAELRTHRGVILRPRAHAVKMHNRAVRRMLTDIGYFVTGKKSMVWFRQAGYENSFQPFILTAQLKTVAKELAMAGRVMSTERFRKMDMDEFDKNEVGRNIDDKVSLFGEDAYK